MNSELDQKGISMSDRLEPMLLPVSFGTRSPKSWAISVTLQSAAVLLLFTAATSKVAPQKAVRLVTLFDPQIASYRTKAPARSGGGDHSPLRASKGALPKASPRPFTPPSAVMNNVHPILAMEPSIAAPLDVALPRVDMSQYGDPLERIGPPSNGRGSNGGIGEGDGGSVGRGQGEIYSPTDGGGVRVWRVMPGRVSAPSLLYKVEPEYSEEARKAKYQGTVLLWIEVDASGKARNVRVVRSLGLGLDEKAIEAVGKWRFKPGYKDGKPVTVGATVEVNFRLL
jgi:protein TonB